MQGKKLLKKKAGSFSVLSVCFGKSPGCIFEARCTKMQFYSPINKAVIRGKKTGPGKDLARSYQNEGITSFYW